MDDDQVREIIKITVEETVKATIQAVQSIINTYINAIEDGWQKSNFQQREQSQETVEIIVGTLSRLTSIIDELNNTTKKDIE